MTVVSYADTHIVSYRNALLAALLPRDIKLTGCEMHTSVDTLSPNLHAAAVGVSLRLQPARYLLT
jgi:hypothetical protein